MEIISALAFLVGLTSIILAATLIACLVRHLVKQTEELVVNDGSEDAILSPRELLEYTEKKEDN